MISRIVFVALALIALQPRTGWLRAQTSVCGNAVREADEQCDDGNTGNLDGCSAQCKFEQVHRMNQLQLQYNTNTNCTANRFGGAFVGGPTQTELNTSLADAITSGRVSILLVMRGLDDLTGTSDPSLQVGIVNGAPIVPAGTTYDGNSDLDWWYAVDAADIDSSRNPTGQLPGAMSGGLLTATPGSARLKVDFGGSTTPFQFSTLKLSAMKGSTSVPHTSASGNPPGHLASENLNPALSSYQVSGSSLTGEMCGNISAASLAATPIPSGLVGCASFTCSQCYTSSNTLLDLLIGGCSISLIGSQVIATQPDRDVAGVDPVGAGPPYSFTRNSTTKAVNGCRDKNLNSVDLTQCVNDAAYSAFYKFATGRVIGTRACPTPPVASSNSPICEGQTLQLTASGPSGTYQWTGPHGFASTDQNPTIANATAAASGSYGVAVTLAGCTSEAATVTVAVDTKPATPVITAPSSAAAGATGLVASVTAQVGSSYAWTVTNGTLASGQGTNQITFTAGSSGTITLTVVKTSGACSSDQGIASVAIFGAPTNVAAVATSSNSVAVSWTASGGATYEVFRRGPGTTVSFVSNTSSTSFDDSTVAAGAAYLYTVRAVDASGNLSAFSAGDATATVIFTDDPIAAQMTPVKGVHLTQLRAAVAAFRNLAGLDSVTFSDAALNSTVTIKAVHLTQLREALDAARSALSLPVVMYTDPAVIAGGTIVKSAHLTELRNGVK